MIEYFQEKTRWVLHSMFMEGTSSHPHICFQKIRMGEAEKICTNPSLIKESPSAELWLCGEDNCH